MQVQRARARAASGHESAPSAKVLLTHVTLSCGEKHTDLELVIRKDYQLFCSVLMLSFRFGVQNGAALVGLAVESYNF